MFKRFFDVIANLFQPKSEGRVLRILNGERYYIPKRFEEICDLGCGTYGKVISALNAKTNTEVAIKKVKPFEIVSNTRSTYMELLCLKKLKNTNVIELKEIFMSTYKHIESVYIVTEKMDCNLSDYIYYNETHIQSPIIKYIMFQLCNAMQYIHSANLIHRDVKPTNVFMNTDNMEVKIGDFGSAIIQRRYARYEYAVHVGSLWYRAPEMIYGSGHYNQGVDMWSMGCIFAELLRLKPLFPVKDNTQLLRLQCELVGFTNKTKGCQCILDDDIIRGYVSMRPNTEGKIDKLFERFDAQIVLLLKQLFILNPYQRTSARKMLTSEYFTKTSWLPPQSPPETDPLKTSDEPKGKDVKSLRKEMKKKFNIR